MNKRLLLLGVLLLATTGHARVVTDLDNLGGTLRYGVEGPFLNKMLHPPRQGRSVLLADLDGDGYDELAIFTGSGVVAEQMSTSQLHAMWQVNVPVDLAWTLTEGQGRFPRYCDLGLAADINNDGQEEIFLTICDADRTRWYLFVIDPAAEAVILEMSLPSGPDRRADGYWDGYWEASGVLPPGQASPNACLVLTTVVHYDARPRGFTAVDLVSGEIVWRFAMGGNPSGHPTWVGDLEGDGTWEIVATASGPDNLGGEAFSGMSDDHSWLVVVGADGELRRCSPQGGITSGALLHVVDLNGDGVREIITASTGAAQGQKEYLRIFTSELSLVTRSVISGRATGLSASARTDGTASIFLATNAGILGRYRFLDGHIDPPLEAATSGALKFQRHGDLLPKAGKELLVVVDNYRRVVILDEDLHALFTTETQPNLIHEAMIWSPEPSVSFVLVEGQNTQIARLMTNPVVLPVRWFVGIGVALVATAAILVWRRRRRGVEPLPVSRDILAQLLFDLEQSGHGAVAVTRRLRQLQTLLGALRGGFEVSPRLRPHTCRTYEDFAESDLLTVREVLDRADSERFEVAVVQETRQALERIVAVLDELVARDLPTEEVDRQFPQLKQDTETLEDGLQRLRQELEALFSCDLPRVLDRVLWAREYDLERDGVEVRMPDILDGNWAVLVEPKDLRFVLDNLVGNAVAAMADAPLRRLSIDLSREQGSVICRVTDTGKGITDDVRRRLFRTRFSTRDGGGLGLFRSQQLLSRWGGQVELEGSVEGQGSTFAVQLASTGPRLRLVEEPGEAAG